MKSIVIILASLVTISLGYYGYNFIHGDDLIPQEMQEKEYLVNLKIQAFLNAKEQAKKEGKIILVKATMEGCTFCGRMEKGTYLTDEVQAALGDKFIIFDLDIKDPDYKNYVKYYQLNAAPISLFLNHEGVKLTKVMGVQDKDYFLEAIELALEEDIRWKNNEGHDHDDSEHGHIMEEPTAKNLQEQMFDSQKKTIEEMFMRNEKATVNKGVGDYAEVIEKMKEHQEAAFEESFGHTLVLKAYPNPNNGSFKLDIEGEEKEGFLYFTNQNGSVLLKEKINISPNTKTLEYDFPNGNEAIFLRLEQGKNTVTEKVIIQK